jgi:RNase P/RNase MRP subunit POP5
MASKNTGVARTYQEAERKGWTDLGGATLRVLEMITEFSSNIDEQQTYKSCFKCTNRASFHFRCWLCSATMQRTQIRPHLLQALGELDTVDNGSWVRMSVESLKNVAIKNSNILDSTRGEIRHLQAAIATAKEQQAQKVKAKTAAAALPAIRRSLSRTLSAEQDNSTLKGSSKASFASIHLPFGSHLLVQLVDFLAISSTLNPSRTRGTERHCRRR